MGSNLQDDALEKEYELLLKDLDEQITQDKLQLEKLKPKREPQAAAVLDQVEALASASSEPLPQLLSDPAAEAVPGQAQVLASALPESAEQDWLKPELSDEEQEILYAYIIALEKELRDRLDEYHKRLEDNPTGEHKDLINDNDLLILKGLSLLGERVGVNLNILIPLPGAGEAIGNDVGLLAAGATIGVRAALKDRYNRRVDNAITVKKLLDPDNASAAIKEIAEFAVKGQQEAILVLENTPFNQKLIAVCLAALLIRECKNLYKDEHRSTISSKIHEWKDDSSMNYRLSDKSPWCLLFKDKNVETKSGEKVNVLKYIQRGNKTTR